MLASMFEPPPEGLPARARFPRAPSQDDWDAMSEEERRRVIEALPNEVTYEEMSPPEGEHHFRAKIESLDMLERFFGRSGRGMYLACELPVYYPATRRFAPDLLAVRDTGRHIRDKWVVSAEGKGLDLAMEVHYGGDRKKDAERNVAFYASLGIPEYFVFDRARLKLHGFRLPSPTARAYQPILGQRGFLRSEVLEMELVILDEQLRFSYRGAFLSDSIEWISHLETLVDQREQQAAAEAERARAEAERARAEEEHARAEEQRASDLERRLAEAQAEIERLKKR